MKVERSERTDSRYRYRVVDYYVPRCRLRFTYYYAPDGQLRVFWRRKRGQKKGYAWLKPIIHFENHAALLMFESYLLKLLEKYRAPSSSHKAGSHLQGRFVWHDILDRYIGGDNREFQLYMGWRTVHELVKEMRHAGKLPDTDDGASD